MGDGVNNNNNSIRFFIIYVPSQQLQGQLRTQRSVDTDNYNMGNHNMVKHKLQLGTGEKKSKHTNK
jgi:hypothetical protein